MLENSSAEFRSVPQDSEPFGNLPNPSASFGNVPNHSEPFRIIPKVSERGENHTLTVREAARMFEAAGVARTERSIINWCQPNRNGIARLDAYFDPNERKYFVTPQSVELAIAEEKAKAAKVNSESPEPLRNDPHEFGTIPKEPAPQQRPVSEEDPEKIKMLEREIMDLKIVNRGKDYFIEQLKGDMDKFVTKLVDSSHRIGELETRLLQIESPSESSRKLFVRNDSELDS